jgi:hypothetical protein
MRLTFLIDPRLGLIRKVYLKVSPQRHRGEGLTEGQLFQGSKIELFISIDAPL